ncbi:MAG: undecaprenyl/decaprenyl-phosphate alpha-N-acetylglucosaminyl 1-phosphate transferase, partial [Proteobacteria bacterium]|nr:undecaprenyl/decaprenyl-phosphate alpha-N-acetylglucosaminyl 1-phosphate transferase [Pseudomonadota bacterium]
MATQWGEGHLLVVVGGLDDRFGLPATVRFATEIAAALIMVYAGGLQLHDIGDPFGVGVLSLDGFSLIATVIVTVTIVNAYNFVDGADGLAGLLVLIGLIAVAIVGGAGASSTAIALLASTAIVGFLVFNFPVNGNRRLRSFMGDAGSTFLGFIIVWVALGVSQGPDRFISPVYCLWFAAIPVFDCLTRFVRRLVRHVSPLTPGRDHFHHVLYRSG